MIREPKRDGNGKLVTDEADKAKGLKEFLAPVITKGAEGNIPGTGICFPEGRKENVKRFYSRTGVDNKAISTIKKFLEHPHWSNKSHPRIVKGVGDAGKLLWDICDNLLEWELLRTGECLMKFGHLQISKLDCT